MRVTKNTHACIRFEGDASGGVLVVDPGAFGERNALDGADAVLITHEHPDHLDVELLRAHLHRHPRTQVYAHPDVLKHLPGSPVTPGDRFTAAGFTISVHGGQHAEIFPEIPRIPNVGFLIDDGAHSVYVPGDSLEVPDATVDTLFVPFTAPWLKLSESIDFVRAVKPGRAFAVHDGLVNATGAKVYDGHLERFSGCEYRHLPAGSVLP
ncbi:MBL fold metallo-hydrolase [Spirilliplanes yamanashiensis]|uniref:MBL fold metallo-hydrolase n=1 Tax=Spirilliplanes yamanashiensis TaxID=42233 RepID=A0A8J3Y3D6_9ACTN|nr:MBL fold metallo-hydrolase [Spirilliplanes yamanashiensis]MDP9814158.1 L-ascorbate metabolism protein UlaG (beta-lactamase superfamily) [Spirilliplanes yamanashiensis]GIJ00860.1 MBL fold metallo-hydrolase [Spirilliplanes yamanashiensis]